MASVQFFAFNTSIAKELASRITQDAIDHPFRKADGSQWSPSPYQQAVFDWIANGSGCANVRAVAGSGKTTTIVAGLSFIKGIKASDVRASTFHSVGFGAILRKLNLRGNQIRTDANKVRGIARQQLNELEYEMYGDFSVRLVAFAKGVGIGPLEPDTISSWYDLISHHDLYLDNAEATEERGIAIAQDLLRRSNAAAEVDSMQQPVIDFDDMLYLPLLWRLRLWQNDWVLVDEAQDTSPVRRAIAKLALKPGGRLIAVGDPKQAIYGFTGASADAMDLIEKEFNCITLPLTVSYRCPKAVAERVKALVPYFEVPETAKQGEVLELTLADALKRLDRHDAILCRQTRPLIETAFGLIAKGIGCTVLGREIGQGLINLIKNQKAKGIEHLLAKLELFRDREVSKFMARGEEGKAEAVNDRIDCIRTVIDNLPEPERSVPGLIRKIEGLFSDTNGVLTLATIHKVKGREYRRVAILCPELMPSKWARQDWQYEQEINLMYVADTRTIESLYILTGTAKPEPKEEKEAA